MSFIKNLFRKTVIVVLMTLIAGAFSLSPVSFSVPATFVEAAINPEINYQGNLEDSSGNAVSDTTYSIEFNLYTAPTGGSSIWTETNNATTTDGLFSVLLGTNTSLSTVNFNQTLYLGVNVEADGEMSPRKKLGTVPAAFESDRLDGLDSDDFLRATTSDNFESGTLTFDSGTTLDVNGSALFEVSTTTSATSTNLYSSILGINNEYFTDLTGTGLTNSSGALAIDESGLTVENLGTSLTTGSVVFSNGSSLAQDNSNFFWDDSSNELGIGTNSPDSALHVLANSATPVTFERTGNNGNALDLVTDQVNLGFSFRNSNQEWKNQFRDTDGYYTIRDITADTSPFKIFEDAVDDSLVIDENGRIGLQDSDPDYHLEISSSEGGGYFGVTNVSDGDIFEINSSGQVGIGDNSPSYKLDVNGKGRFTGLVDAAYFTSTSTTATSTFAAGVDISGDLALPTGGIYDNNDSLGTDGYVLQSDGSGINWVATSSLGISGGGGGGGATFGQTLELINSTTLAPTTTDAGIGIQADFFNATSTTATSTFQGNLHVYDTLQVGTSSVYITTDLINYDRQIRIGSASTTPEVIIGNVSGNKRGDEAIDLQTSRASITDVASGQSAIAIGGDSTASGLRSVSIGWASDATQSYATAIGYSNIASQSFSSAVGYDNTASGSQSVSFGYSNSVTSSSASAVGLSNTVSSSNASAYGYSNSVTDDQSSAFGYQNTIEQGFTGGTALGNSNDVRESYASAVGYSNSADAEESSAFGSRNTASDTYASAFGYNNTASGGNSTAVGYSNNAAGSNSAVFGTSNQINSSANFASAFGYSNLINSSALKSTAIGFDNTINSSVRNAGAFGWQVTVGANGASAFGSSITNNVASSTMIGPNTDSALILLSNGKAALGTTTPDDTDNLAETFFEVEDHEGDVRFVLDRKDGSGQFSELLFQEGNANKFSLGHDNSNLYFYNYENSEYAMVIEESSSEVGIGTQTPQRTLHVSVGSDTPPVRFEDTNGYCEINPTSATWNCTSDQTLKENINSLSSSEELEKLRQLRPVEFEWKSDESNKKVTGLIAQEVEEVLPELVITDKESGLKSVGYGGLITYLLSAVQELADKVEQLAVRGYAAAVGAFQQLIVGSPSEPGGIQMYDEETGDPYCITIRGGSIITRSGTCDIDPEDVLFEKEIHVLEDETEQTSSEENSETGNENTKDVVEDTSTSTPETIEEEEETTNEEDTETSSSTPEIIEEENSETEETVQETTDTDAEETPAEENVVTEEETVETQTESEPEEEVPTDEDSETEEVTPETSE